MARLCQPGGKANEGAGGARERRVFPGLKTAKTMISRILFITRRTAFRTSLSSMINWSVNVVFV